MRAGARLRRAQVHFFDTLSVSTSCRHSGNAIALKRLKSRCALPAFRCPWSGACHSPKRQRAFGPATLCEVAQQGKAAAPLQTDQRRTVTELVRGASVNPETCTAGHGEKNSRRAYVFRTAPDSCRKRAVPALTFSATSRPPYYSGITQRRLSRCPTH